MMMGWFYLGKWGSILDVNDENYEWSLNTKIKKLKMNSLHKIRLQSMYRS